MAAVSDTDWLFEFNESLLDPVVEDRFFSARFNILQFRQRMANNIAVLMKSVDTVQHRLDALLSSARNAAQMASDVSADITQLQREEAVNGHVGRSVLKHLLETKRELIEKRNEIAKECSAVNVQLQSVQTTLAETRERAEHIESQLPVLWAAYVNQLTVTNSLQWTLQQIQAPADLGVDYATKMSELFDDYMYDMFDEADNRLGGNRDRCGVLHASGSHAIQPYQKLLADLWWAHPHRSLLALHSGGSNPKRTALVAVIRARFKDLAVASVHDPNVAEKDQCFDVLVLVPNVAAAIGWINEAKEIASALFGSMEPEERIHVIDSTTHIMQFGRGLRIIVQPMVTAFTERARSIIGTDLWCMEAQRTSRMELFQTEITNGTHPYRTHRAYIPIQQMHDHSMLELAMAMEKSDGIYELAKHVYIPPPSRGVVVVDNVMACFDHDLVGRDANVSRTVNAWLRVIDMRNRQSWDSVHLRGPVPLLCVDSATDLSQSFRALDDVADRSHNGTPISESERRLIRVVQALNMVRFSELEHRAQRPPCDKTVWPMPQRRRKLALDASLDMKLLCSVLDRCELDNILCHLGQKADEEHELSGADLFERHYAGVVSFFDGSADHSLVLTTSEAQAVEVVVTEAQLTMPLARPISKVLDDFAAFDVAFQVPLERYAALAVTGARHVMQNRGRRGSVVSGEQHDNQPMAVLKGWGTSGSSKAYLLHDAAVRTSIQTGAVVWTCNKFILLAAVLLHFSEQKHLVVTSTRRPQYCRDEFENHFERIGFRVLRALHIRDFIIDNDLYTTTPEDVAQQWIRHNPVSNGQHTVMTFDFALLKEHIGSRNAVNVDNCRRAVALTLRVQLALFNSDANHTGSVVLAMLCSLSGLAECPVTRCRMLHMLEPTVENARVSMAQASVNFVCSNAAAPAAGSPDTAATVSADERIRTFTYVAHETDIQESELWMRRQRDILATPASHGDQHHELLGFAKHVASTAVDCVFLQDYNQAGQVCTTKPIIPAAPAASIAKQKPQKPTYTVACRWAGPQRRQSLRVSLYDTTGVLERTLECGAQASNGASVVASSALWVSEGPVLQRSISPLLTFAHELSLVALSELTQVDPVSSLDALTGLILSGPLPAQTSSIWNMTRVQGVEALVRRLSHDHLVWFKQLYADFMQSTDEEDTIRAKHEATILQNLNSARIQMEADEDSITSLLGQIVVDAKPHGSLVPLPLTDSVPLKVRT